jgi:hypothetical protein
MVNATPSSYPKKAELWGLEVQLSSETACLACSRPWVQSPALQKGKKKKKKKTELWNIYHQEWKAPHFTT